MRYLILVLLFLLPATSEAQHGHPCHAIAMHVNDINPNTELLFDYDSSKEYASFIGTKHENLGFINSFRGYVAIMRKGGYSFVEAEESSGSFMSNGIPYKKAVWLTRRGVSICRVTLLYEDLYNGNSLIIFNSLN